MSKISNSKITTETAKGIYIHIPFCVSKCAYCDFYSLPCQKPKDIKFHGAPAPFSEEIISLQKSYTEALCRQIALIGERHARPKISTVFIGGGTPSVLSAEDMHKITDSLYRCFDIQADAELTLEANPETLSREKLTEYGKMGINRLSLGMQSANDSELKTLSRIHTVDGVKRAFSLARKAGFDNINLDIMYALPGQTLESFRITLDTVASLQPEHISVYGLQLEEGTPLFNKRKSLTFPGDDGENEMNALALSVLSECGYRRYEISNYSRPGFECRHNLGYWRQREYFGFGTAAHSFVGGVRYSIKKDIGAFIASKDFSDVTVTEEVLSEEELTEEKILLSLRLCSGISLENLKDAEEKTGVPYLKRAEVFIRGGFMEIRDGSLRFTTKGFNVSNTVLSEIIYG